MVDLTQVSATPSPDLLTPDNAVMLFVDHQPQMFSGTGSGDRMADGTQPHVPVQGLLVQEA